MIGTTLAIIALTTQKSTLPTDLKSLQEAMAADSRKLKAYKDAWLLTTSAGDAKSVVKVLRSIDGERGVVGAFVGGEPLLLMGSDGKMSYFIHHGAEVFAQFERGNAWLAKPMPLDAKQLSDGDFNLNPDGIYDFLISSKPELKFNGFTSAIHEDKKVKVANLGIKRDDGVSGVDLRLWFPADSFVLLRAEAEVNAQGRKITFKAVRERISTGVKFTLDEFSFKKQLTEGYREMVWSKLVPGFAGTK